MERRKLRNIEVSEIGMGCMGFSHGYGQIPKHDYSIEAIREAYNYGCTFFDTAESYGNVLYYEGHNEEILGEAIESFRKNVVLATKLHITILPLFVTYSTIFTPKIPVKRCGQSSGRKVWRENI